MIRNNFEKLAYLVEKPQYKHIPAFENNWPDGVRE